MSNNQPIFICDDVHLAFVSHHLFKQATLTHALRGVSFSVSNGESVGIIGDNGSGKSTLFRVMAGIMYPDQGKIINNKGSITLLTFGGGLFSECSGRDNAIMLLMLQEDITIAEAREKCIYVADFADLKYHFDMPVKTYSSGMLARLRFAVGLQGNPDILLIDEVIVVGDLLFIKKSFEATEKRISEGSTIFLITHVLELVAKFCTRTIWLKDGKIMADGETEKVINEYKKYLEYE